MLLENFTPFVQIPLPENGTRWVIADVHGCPRTLKYLVEEVIGLSKDDQLFLLGDYIDRGPDSGAVINQILEWQKLNYQVFPLRGNHEDMLLDTYLNYPTHLFKGMLKIQKCLGMTDEQGEIRPHYLDFIKKLPYYYESGRFYLVHAGFNFEKENPFEDYQGMLWVRNIENALFVRVFESKGAFLNGKHILRGHVPHNLTEIRESIAQRKTIIPLDNGCVYHFRKAKYPGKYEDMGNLLALNLDTWELSLCPNIDTPPPSRKGNDILEEE